MPAATAKAVANAALFHNGSNPIKNPVKIKPAICEEHASWDSIGSWLDESEIS
jgi:hypothetical protein